MNNIIALTGGIGSGKTFVSSILHEEYGYDVVSADEISKDIFNRKKIQLEIINNFGNDILGKNKIIDKKKLAKIVFSSKQKTKKLNEIMIPKISEVLRENIKNYKKNNKKVVFEIPLLFENNLENNFDKVVLIYSTKKNQISRTKLRDGRQEEDIKNIINNQMNIEKKILLSDFVINNSYTRENTKKQIKKII